ncbi:MAG: isopenicillin N synthase family oxygenase [Leptolyngbyaceae cyanobacterium SM1_4_3]|nr:isopenicillin N synthase family oxygenase [Leptolyngbyaceae cyanobacterium SM1_4_3]NJN89201.1 isopenicillin N synthase family oxygenase [Leptolyngbyaceae cyanobacterium SL_5_14]
MTSEKVAEFTTHPSTDAHLTNSISKNTSFPVINIAPLFTEDRTSRQQCIEQIKHACLTVGFFGAKGACSQDLINRVYRQSANFHSLSDADKRPYYSLEKVITRGWVPLHEEPAYEPGTISHVESFDLGLHLPPDDPDYVESPLLGPNVYPDLIGFREDIDAYYTEINHMGSALLEAFAEMLELERNTFRQMSTRRAGSKMRLLHYPGADEQDRQPEGSSPEGIKVGISSHSDFEMLTIMHQNAPGLQLMNRNEEWVDVPVIPDAFSVILDDALEFLTNGVLKATQHRVPLTTWERYSLIMFHAADVDQVLQPLPEFVSAENPSRYLPITQSAHILQQTYAGIDNSRKMEE